MTEESYRVDGMVCGHCASAVTEEIRHLGGVTEVSVDVDHGTVTVACHHYLRAADVRAAVEAAGYEFAGPVPRSGS